MGCAPSRNVAKPTETEDTAAGKRTARVNPQQNETTSESEGATTSLAPTCPAPHAFRVLSIADQRKKSKVSISALFRVGHRNSVFVNEPEPEGTLAPKRPARRGSSIDTDRTPFHRDISLRGSKGIYFPPGATEISGMTLKTLLAEPSTCKTFVRFLSHRDSFPASVEAVETTMRTSLFARSTLIVSAGKATTITANPNDLDKIVTFLGDLGRLRELEHAWDVCVRNRRRSNVETRAASPIAPADNPTSLDSFDDGMIGACIMLPAAFAAALHAWYFEKGGLLAPLFPKDSVPTQPDGRIGWSSRHFFKAEQHGLASIPQKLLLEFKRSVMAGEIPRSPAAPTAGQMSPTGAPKKTVIVLGGGICGITICQDIEAIDDTFHTILIDKKDYFEFTPLVIRNLTGTAKPIPAPLHVPIKTFLRSTEVICGKVTHVTPHSVDVNYRRIPYDYLVIATGARARSMLKPQCVTKLQRQQSISACSAPSVTPRNVVVIGGGPSAIEYAALAKTANPTATVSLYSDTPSLLPRVKDGGAVHDTVLKRLQEVGVDVHLGRRLIGSGANDGTFTLVKGGKERISPDSVVWCTGTVPNTSFLKNGFSSILDPAGRVKVLRTMQVVGYKHIFAGGDVCMRFAFEEKCVETALSHANVIVRNILRLSEGQKLSDHREVRGMNDQIIDFGPGPGLCIKGETMEPCDTIAGKNTQYEKVVDVWLAKARGEAHPLFSLPAISKQLEPTSNTAQVDGS